MINEDSRPCDFLFITLQPSMHARHGRLDSSCASHWWTIKPTSPKLLLGWPY